MFRAVVIGSVVMLTTGMARGQDQFLSYYAYGDTGMVLIASVPEGFILKDVVVGREVAGSFLFASSAEFVGEFRLG